MKRLYEYLDMISQEDIHDYVEKMKYSNDMYITLPVNCLKLRQK